MRKVFMIALLALILTDMVSAQDTNKIIPNYRSIQISLGLGIRYHRDNPYEKEVYWPKGAEKFLPSYAFDIEIAKDFWSTGRHFLGVEILGYPDTYGESAGNPKDFSLVLNILYKRNGYLTKKIIFTTDVGFGLFSNDAASFLNYFINLQIQYTFKNYSLFIKNNFRWWFQLGLGAGAEIPWISTVGIAIKI